MKNKLLIFNAHLVDANFEKKNSAIFIENGKISGFPEKQTLNKLLKDEAISKYDAKNCIVCPSFIDFHAHFRDPGLTYKEDIRTGSMAAAAGGFGTLVLMPNTNPTVSSINMAKEINQKAKDEGFADVIQSISITKNFDGKSIDHLNDLDSKITPVITEDGKEVANPVIMFEAMKIAAKKNLIVACHCEDPELAAKARSYRQEALKNLQEGNKKKAQENLKLANELLELAEDICTERNILLAEKAKCRIHLCHVSTIKSINYAIEAKKRGVNLTFEITPHHLGLNGEKAPNIFHIVNPPLRTELDRLACIDALKSFNADIIGTDHAPHSEEDKLSGAPGFSGLETAFSVAYTELVKNNNLTLSDLSRLMSYNAAQILNLKNKGLLEEGYEANLTVIDTEKQWTVKGEEFASKGKYTPLENKKLYGVIKATFLRGNIVFQD